MQDERESLPPERACMTLSDRFSAELALIQDLAIREFTRQGLDAAPAYVATAPATTSGRYHPPDERGPGGMVLHWRRVARLTDELCRMRDITGWERDCLIAASLLHDIVAQGLGPESIGATWPGHEIEGIAYLERAGLRHLIPQSQWGLIAWSIAGHAGRWGSPDAYFPDPAEPEYIVHLADYVASRACVTIEPLVEGETTGARPD